ncbi:nucleolar GTP-binding protein 1 [Plasmodium brasilianum]|uniref:Nucleolar GTP-binding protein 1, putative n=2 Tax=Plasmodium (Plasmodium) TaxID=418103 RepID=A0A1A8W820_PLAMA|nr:nucleolar GTP-binding protein 1, putative [Plasmodium malariae]KAI4837366.1 nucleolar GTP-binding protein 1 [Plasmodium brasilianum]SBS87329.1 nucleolar GTP-binding protein 1, putative [Plasmodium malariae]SCO93250.1 nucleolar GTP-binding protein 1, putative [Plasmodium malariae]
MKDASLYRFKDIKPVVNAKELVDVVLSKTQRKTPTEIHKGFKITRIRNFYMRKVKMCQELFRDKLQTIINDFPKLDDIHPFYADLANILYDRDHYKLALGQCNYVSKSVIRISHDYIKLLKFSSSLYKCKILKISALGRMCKLVKKLQPSLLYLEEVRQNLSRLPSINPHKKTILLSGAPNVGKSSFINIISRANVEVQPYSFTTRNLYVGHFDYKLNRYQVIDTPGLLDRSLENRNTIEMTTITALAHINGVILFIIDISEECGLSIKEQVNLFYSIKSLFSNKSIVIGFNKIDKGNIDSLPVDSKLLIKQIAIDINSTIKFCSFSTLTGVGVEEAKIIACDLLKTDYSSDILLDQENLLKSKLNEHKINLNRAPFIPDSVIQEKIRKMQQKGRNKLNGKEEELDVETTDGDYNEEEENSTKGAFLSATNSTVDDMNGANSNDDQNRGNIANSTNLTMRELKLKKKNKSRQSYLSNRTDNRILQIDLQNENGGAGVYSVDIRRNYDIKEEYKYDVIPEIFNGKNICDFVDINIEQKLMELEKEEETLLDKDVQIDPMWFKTKRVLEKMALKLKRLKLHAKLNEEKQPLYHKKNKTVEEMEKKLDELKLDKQKILESMTEKLNKRNSLNGTARKENVNRESANRESVNRENIKKEKVKKDICKKKQIKDAVYNDPTKKSKIYLSTSTELQRKKAYRLNKIAYKKIVKGTKGEADRSIPCKRPRHLFSGKRSIGKAAWR